MESTILYMGCSLWHPKTVIDMTSGGANCCAVQHGAGWCSVYQSVALLLPKYSSRLKHCCWVAGREVAQRLKWLSWKCDKLSLNPQNPHKATCGNVHLSLQNSYSKWEGETGESLMDAAMSKRPVSGQVEGEDWHPRLRSDPLCTL